jgi:hypothetical protein
MVGQEENTIHTLLKVAITKRDEMNGTNLGNSQYELKEKAREDKCQNK